MRPTPKKIEYEGFEFNAPADAPAGQWLKVWGADNHISIRFKTKAGEWWRGVGGEPRMERTRVQPVGWVPL